LTVGAVREPPLRVLAEGKIPPAGFSPAQTGRDPAPGFAEYFDSLIWLQNLTNEYSITEQQHGNEPI
jgi:hypothetical protein